MKKTILGVAILFSAALLTVNATAELLVYEGFQYGAASDTRTGAALLDGQPNDGGDVDATGLSGAWSEEDTPTSTTDLFMYSGSLAFGDLATSGNSVRTDTNNNDDRFSRSISASLDGGTELWFSFLANKLQNNNDAAEGGLVIGNQVVNSPRVLLDDGTTGLAGFGIAPTTAGNNWTAYAWDGSSQTVGDAAYGVPVNGSETNLLIGKIVFDAGAGGTDQFSLYYYDKGVANITADTGNLVAIATTIEVDVTQSALDTLSLTRQVNTAYDEIRMGTTLNDVLGLGAVPEPASMALLGLAGAVMLGRRKRRS